MYTIVHSGACNRTNTMWSAMNCDSVRVHGAWATTAREARLDFKGPPLCLG